MARPLVAAQLFREAQTPWPELSEGNIGPYHADLWASCRLWSFLLEKEETMQGERAMV
jgi:hypothetical protein